MELLADAEGKTLSDITQYDSLKATPSNALRAVLGAPLIEKLEAEGTRVQTIWARTEDLHPFEAASFPAMVLREFAAETWETSQLKQHVDRILLVSVMSEERDASGARIMGKAFFWSPSEAEMAGIAGEWREFQEAVRTGKAAYKPTLDDEGHERRNAKGKEMRENALPRQTRYIHLRPKAQDKNDTDEDPHGNQVTKQAFWLNKDFLQSLLNSATRTSAPEPAKAKSAPSSPTARKPASADTSKLPHGNLASLLRAMRRESKTSVITSGDLPPLNKALYIPDWVDEEVDNFLRRGHANLLVLTGSAGHGKSAAIAVARQTAAALGVEPVVRPDASHADAPDEDYRVGLRRFLDRWQGSRDGDRFILGINLGKALDFFSDKANAERYLGLAEAFDHEFRLGLSATSRPNPAVSIIDISHRIRPQVTGEGLDLPWVRAFLRKMDPEGDESVVNEAFRHQLTAGLGKFDPLVVNLRLMALPPVREHLLEALVSAVVRHDVHLTPRRVMDFVSRLVLPSEAEALLDANGDWTAEGAAILSDAQRWGPRLNASLFQQLFPDAPELAAFDQGLAVALRRENPTYTRSRFMDQRILQWAADPATLSKDMPVWFLEFLGWKGERVGDDGRRLLIQVAAWTLPKAPPSPRVERVKLFLSACRGDADARHKCLEPIKSGLRHYVTRAFFREWDDERRPDSIAVQVYRFSFNSRLTTKLEEFHVGYVETPGRRWLLPEFQIEVERGGRPITLTIDWATFDLLMDVAHGFNPSSGESGSTVTLNRLQRALQSASALDHFLEWRDEHVVGRLTMTREGTTQKAKVHAEVHD
ncbi:MAG: MutH/Sau3AI family endonuclease [Thermoplasmatota archaeon]